MHRNNDPQYILHDIYPDLRNFPDLIEHTHPYFDPEKIAFRQYFTGQGLSDPLDNAKINIVVNYEPDEILFRKLLGDKNYILSGTYKTKKHSREEYYPWHLIQVARNNNRQEIAYPVSRKYIADVLFGWNTREHRQHLFALLKDTPSLFNNCLISLSKPEWDTANTDGEVYASPEIERYEDSRINATKISPTTWHSMTRIKISIEGIERIIPASQIIPKKIYDNSSISVVSETHADQIFITEKTAKPIAAGRIFLISAERGFLQALRDIGFKTFDGIIDESYDNLSTVEERNAAIVKELLRLSELDMQKLYDQAMPILRHNQEFLYSEQAMTPVKKFLEKINANHG